MSAASCVPCSRPACLCAKSTRSSFASSLERAEFFAKNDPLDARMIASFVAIMPTRPVQRLAPAGERLVEMLAVRRQLSAEKIAAENASRLLEDTMLRRLARRRVARLAR
jgi:transposase